VDAGRLGVYPHGVPIYEYVCMECESHFEELVRGDEQVACPDCSATNVSKQFSRFAVHGAAAQPIPECLQVRRQRHRPVECRTRDGMDKA